MKKEEALERLTALEAEAKALREIIEKPEHEVNSIEDVINIVKPKWFADADGIPFETNFIKDEDVAQHSTEKLAEHCLLYTQLKEVEKYVNEIEGGEIDWKDSNSRKYSIYYSHKTGNIHIDYWLESHGNMFHFISDNARSEFIRIAGDKLKEFYLTAY